MVDLKTNLSAEAKQYLKLTADGSLDICEKAMLLFPAISDHTISHGKAAELLGIQKRDLIELYANMGIPYVNQSWEEVEEDMHNIEIVIRKRAGTEAKRA